MKLKSIKFKFPDPKLKKKTIFFIKKKRLIQGTENLYLEDDEYERNY